jgi:hypothetical protein
MAQNPMEQPDEFELARKQAAQQVQSGVQQQKDALKRRFAALGGLNSGAAIKQEQLAEESGAQRLDQANQVIGSAQRKEAQRLREVQEGRDFARSEREASQGFARDMSREQMRGQQEFASNEAEKQRAFATGERTSSQKFSAEQAKMAQDLQSSQFGKQMEMADRQFAEDQYINRENLRIANKMAGKKGMFESMFSASTYSGAVNDIMSPADPGSKIICTAYYKLGWLPYEILKADLEYQKRYAPISTIKNYLAWAQYVVPVIQTNRLARYAYWPIARSWAYTMAYRMGVVKKKPLFGFMFETVFLVLSNILGSSIRKYKKMKRNSQLLGV